MSAIFCICLLSPIYTKVSSYIAMGAGRGRGVGPGSLTCKANKVANSRYILYNYVGVVLGVALGSGLD